MPDVLRKGGFAIASDAGPTHVLQENRLRRKDGARDKNL